MKKDGLISPSPRGKTKLFLIMKLSVLMMFVPLVMWAGPGHAQQQMSLNVKNASLEEVLEIVRTNSGYFIFYNIDDIKEVKGISIETDNSTINEVLDKALEGTSLRYAIENRTIIISTTKVNIQQPVLKAVAGTVKDDTGKPVFGCNVVVEGTTRGTMTNAEGRFSLNVPNEAVTLTFSFLGMETRKVELPMLPAGQNHRALDIVLAWSQLNIDDVVVTGIFERKAESFTGTAATYKGSELRAIGTQNVFQGLSVLDPSFILVQNDITGSNPNVLPEININGRTTVVDPLAQYENDTDPNRPLFVLDGFKTDMKTVMMISMSRIENIVILKDAAATAIYGADAANGVVIIETVRPKPGELTVQYTGDFSVQWADLSDYNLMNAAEKLEFERLSGVVYSNNDSFWNYDLQLLYNERLRRVQSGVDQYWLDVPLRTAFTNKHDLYVSGGDRALVYGLGVNYANTQGVMKQSGNTAAGLTMSLAYNVKNFKFRNDITVSLNSSDNEPVSYSSFSRANPYHDEEAVKAENRFLEDYTAYREDRGRILFQEGNPNYNASLNYLNGGSERMIKNNFYAEWNPFMGFKAVARFSYADGRSDSERFISPYHTQFEQTPLSQKGTYTKTNYYSYNYSGNVTLTYSNIFREKHILNLAATFDVSERKLNNDTYTGQGFADDSIPTPDFAQQYAVSGGPGYSETLSRSVYYFINGAYMYDNRYAFDFTIRRDGANNFGSNKIYTTTWSAGFKWNIHREEFSPDWIDRLSLGYNIGNPGNRNMQYLTQTTYRTSSIANIFGNGTYPNNFANNDLSWEKVLKHSVNLDFTGFNRRLSVQAQYEHRKADPLILNINSALSTGRSVFPINVGYNTNQIFTFKVSTNIIQDFQNRIIWNVGVSGRHLTSKLGGLDNMDESNSVLRNNSSLYRFRNGSSQQDMWMVRSGGIDPVTGNEIFIKKDGTYSFEHNSNDEVVVGNSNPALTGVINTNFTYKGLTVGLYLQYILKGYKVDQQLYNKVEGITSSQVKNQNQDKRALYDRWQKTGDIAKFRRITDFSGTNKLTDRFLRKEYGLFGNSISVSYNFDKDKWLEKSPFENLRASFIMNDIFRLSNVRQERGIDYPYERLVTLSIQMTF